MEMPLRGTHRLKAGAYTQELVGRAITLVRLGSQCIRIPTKLRGENENTAKPEKCARDRTIHGDPGPDLCAGACAVGAERHAGRRAGRRGLHPDRGRRRRLAARSADRVPLPHRRTAGAPEGSRRRAFLLRP